MYDKKALEFALQTGEEIFTSVFGKKRLKILADLEFTDPIEKVDLGKLKVLFEKSVEFNMAEHKDKKIGIMLSGGLDSTLGGYLIKKAYPDIDMIAYYGIFGDKETDESEYAKFAADYLGIPLKIVDTGLEIQKEYLFDTIKSSNAIRVGLLYAYPLFKYMADDGMEIVVNTTGPDEYFGAYTMHKRWYNRSRFKFFPWINTKGKYDRYAAIKFGTDKAWFINNIFISPGNEHVIGGRTSNIEFYEKLWEGNLWNNINRFLMEKVAGNYETMMRQPVEYLGMELVYPYMYTDLINYCFSLDPQDVYNKKPMRALMRSAYQIPEKIYRRGEDWSIDYGGKVGWGPNMKSYFVDRSIINTLYDISNVDELLKEHFTDYVIKNLNVWKDRRVIQIGLFLRQLIKENRGL